MEPVQTEYHLAYFLTAAFVLLGILLVCVPRPRKQSLEDPKKTGRKEKKKK